MRKPNYRPWAVFRKLSPGTYFASQISLQSSYYCNASCTTPSCTTPFLAANAKWNFFLNLLFFPCVTRGQPSVDKSALKFFFVYNPLVYNPRFWLQMQNEIFLKKCFVHFSQNINRQMCRIDGFRVRYGNDRRFALPMCMLAALAFVPPHIVEEYFEELSDPTTNLVPPEAIFLPYIEDTYIGRPQRGRQCRWQLSFPIPECVR